MRTATIIIVTGLILLFLGSLYLGPKVFSPIERRLDRQLAQAQHMPPQIAQVTRKVVEYKKIRLAFGSFDLMGGLTIQELDDLAKPSPPRPFVLFPVWLFMGDLRFQDAAALTSRSAIL
jgi:hypothetical protein